MTSWSHLRIAPDGTHHVGPDGAPLYADRFHAVLPFHPPGLAPVRRHGEAWYIRPDGSPAHARRFIEAFGYYEGLAAVVSPDGWHHVDEHGDDAYADRHAWCGNFQEGRCPIRSRDGTYHHIAPDGSPAYAARWRYVGDFRHGIAVVQAEDGRSTHIGPDGGFVHETWFLDLDVYHKGFARARDEDGWTHVDRAGRPAYTRRFAMVEPFYNGQARVQRFDGGLEVIDEAGNTLVQLRPALRSPFAELSADLVGCWRTRTIATAVEVGIFEHLPGDTGTIARRCELAASATRRLLRALAELHLVERHDGAWRPTPRGHLLRRDHPMTLADAALEYDGPLDRRWRVLAEALQGGEAWRPPDVFAEVAAEPGRTDGHHRMLRSYALHDYPAVPRALDLRGHQTVIDAGGGTGALARMLVERYPEVEVIILDRPEVVARARRGGLPDRVTARAADLLAPWGVHADIVLLARVLHDWPDEDAVRILRHARRSLDPGGRVYVIEMTLPEDGFSGGLCDLHLLVATGGAERTEEEYARLLTRAGFSPAPALRLPDLPSIIMGVAQ